MRDYQIESVEGNGGKHHPDGVTTEFIHCPDPTASGIVVKVTRTAIFE